MNFDTSHIGSGLANNKLTPVLVGVSAGVDSMVLAHILISQKLPIAIAHCNFKLRGAAAINDEDFVREFADKNQVPFHTISFETSKYAASQKVSIQMAARTLRYKWFDKLCDQNGYEQIAVGTHLTDSIETFIFNATKGTGLAGLRGIKEQNGRVIRPLLKASKQDIYAYADKHKIAFREDLSNAETKYARNKIRHKVLPVLKEINPNLSDTFVRNFSRLQRTETFLNVQLNEAWNTISKTDSKKIIIDKNALSAHAFADLVLQFGLKEFGFTEVQLTDALNSMRVGAKFESTTHTLLIERQSLIVFKTPKENPVNQYLIREFLGEITHPIHLVFKDDFVHEIAIQKSMYHAYFDFDTLQFPLTLRCWKPGDKMKPFGMHGSKKVSDILTDAKIPAHQKPTTLVLLSNEKIIWVVGVRASKTCSVTSKTKRIYAIEYRIAK